MEVIHKKTKSPKLAIIETRPLTELAEQQEIEVIKQCEQFTKWLSVALPNEKICYHKGTYVSGKKIASLVWQAYERGQVTMFQSRDGSQYYYWAQRILPRKKK